MLSCETAQLLEGAGSFSGDGLPAVSLLTEMLVAGFAPDAQFAGLDAVGDTPPWMEAIRDPEADGAAAVSAGETLGAAVPVAFAVGTCGR